MIERVDWIAATGAPTRLILLRHAQTEYSVSRRYSGRGNPQLTETGVRQAKLTADRLSTMDRPVAVVSSPLVRAEQTAEAVARSCGVPLEVWESLTETDFGAWEGLTFAEAAQRDPELHRLWCSDPTVPTPGGESFTQVHDRVRVALDDLTKRYAGSTIVVVSHVTPIKTLLRLGLRAGPNVLLRIHLDLASLSIVEFYPDGNAVVRLVNDTAHLDPIR